MTYKFKKPARPVTRVFIHCSASDNPAHDSAGVMDAWHKKKGWAGIGYHFFIRKADGALDIGRDIEKVPAAQGDHNTGTIAICLHGLKRDQFTEAQFDTLRALCAQINAAYAGRVTFHGHCEVAAKTCPVFIYQDVLGIDAKGLLPLSGLKPDVPIQTPSVDFGGLEYLPINRRVLKLGDRGDNVVALQRRLTGLGYHTGAIDGVFGKRTRASVMAFQADNALEPDGKVGPLTYEALGQEKPREIAQARAFASLSDLAAAGSRIAKASRNNIAIGAILGGGGLATVIDEVTGQADVIQKLFNDHGLITGAVILAAGAFVAWQSWRAGQARVEDHRTGKTA